MRHLDAGFAAEVEAEYKAITGDPGPRFKERINHYWELREFDGLRFAIQFDDPAEFEDGLQALRDGPLLSAPHD